ncbi:MAG: fluoride efflux transporter CrcB [Bacteroidales bacterium]
MGGAIRYLLFLIIDQTGKQFSFPLKTFLVNIIGCFALGLFYGMADRVQFTDNQVILFLTIGLCGGFTTFSAFSHDNMELLKNGNFLLALFYVLITVLLSFVALYLGNRVTILSVNS